MPEIGGHRGRFWLVIAGQENKIIPKLDFSVPRLASLDCELKRNNASTFETFTIIGANILTDANTINAAGNPMVFAGAGGPASVMLDWHKDIVPAEPILQIALDQETDSHGEFIIPNYPSEVSANDKINSKYYVSYLRPRETSGTIKVGYGLSFSWTNNNEKSSPAYLAAITGYKIPRGATFKLHSSDATLEPTSHVFYYLVIATPSALDPEESGITSWSDLEVTIDLAELSTEANNITLSGTTDWDFYWQPVTDTNRGTGFVERKIDDGQWLDDRKKFKFSYSQGQPQTGILGHLFLLNPNNSA